MSDRHGEHTAHWQTKDRDAAPPKSDPANSDLAGFGPPVVIQSGPFAGWSTWSEGGDPFETHNGPYCFKEEPDGRVRAAFQPTRTHLNGAGKVHGGALMSFADFALFALAARHLEGAMAVTATFNAEFLGAGTLDGWIEAQGEVVRATRSLVFVQARLVQRDAPILAFSSALKKIAQR